MLVVGVQLEMNVGGPAERPPGGSGVASGRRKPQADAKNEKNERLSAMVVFRLLRSEKFEAMSLCPLPIVKHRSGICSSRIMAKVGSLLDPLECHVMIFNERPCIP